jgi:hypothetical protein
MIDDNKENLKDSDYLVMCNSMKELFNILINVSTVSSVSTVSTVSTVEHDNLVRQCMDLEQKMFDLNGIYPEGVEEAIIGASE